MNASLVAWVRSIEVYFSRVTCDGSHAAAHWHTVGTVDGATAASFTSIACNCATRNRAVSSCSSPNR